MLGLEGKVVLVTGASRGIGMAVARAFSEAGAMVAVAAREADALERVAEGLRAGGGRAIAVPADVTDPDAVARMVERVVTEFGRLDIACNNAASGHPPTPLADISVDAFDASLAVSLRGVFLCMRQEIPAMLEAGGGAIVNNSSTAGLQGVAGLAPYVSAKHGLEGLTKVGALDYAARGIRVNSVAPGPILTDALARAGAAAQEGAAAAMPMQRVGHPDEVAAAILWLCSDEASFITGATLAIDGGKLAGTPAFNVGFRST